MYTLFFLSNLYGLEHELPVVEGPQVFGDVETHGADGGEQVQHHWNHLHDSRGVRGGGGGGEVGGRGGRGGGGPLL